MKRTNVVLDEIILDQAKNLTGIKVTRQVLDYALRELVQRRRQRAILNLQGKIDWQGDLSKIRRGRHL